MTANGDNRVMIDCPHCKQRFSSKSAPQPDQPINLLKCSIVVATHERPIRCENAKCGKYFVFVVAQAELAWAVAPITDEQAATLGESKLLLPPVPWKSLNLQ